MKSISRRYFARILAGSALAAPWLFGFGRAAWGQKANGDDELVYLDGWIVKRSQVPEDALQRVSPLDL